MTKIAVIVTQDRKYGVNMSFELLGINPVKGKQVVFKPNFNTADPPPACTHMDTLEQMIVKMKEMGAKSITLAERSGPAKTSEVFEKLGVDKLAYELGFELVDLSEVTDDNYIRLKPKGSHWKDGFLFAKIYQDAEAIVETCCLKTHQYGGHFTLSMKNATGLVPRDGFDLMKELHSSEHQRKMIAEINAVYKPDIVIMDGVIAFIDGGPMEGTRKEANVFVAGTDKIAIDAVGVALLRILGTTPEVTKGSIFEQEQIARAVELGIGISSPDEIEFVTDSPEAEELVKKIKEKLSE
ncbi:MAG: DUF362 domain-containing protein [Asgard group archaeon]|nr:DUF362 domain-containing protein [Asgard group archaeon]